jgi:FkbM family methyltransferase
MEQNLVLDLGMNNGDDTAYYLRSGYKVVAVEANKTLAEQGKRRFRREISKSQLTILNIGIGACEGELDFWICDDNPFWSSFDRNLATTQGCSAHAEKVEVKPFSYLLERYGVPFFLKIDIEGQEHACLQSLGPELPAYLAMEAYSEDDLFKLGKAGYKRFQCISQYYFLPVQAEPCQEAVDLASALRPKNLFATRILSLLRLKYLRYRLRRRNGWWFRLGSSGRMPHESQSHWMNFEEMMHAYLIVKAEAEQGLHRGIHQQGNRLWINFYASL